MRRGCLGSWGQHVSRGKPVEQGGNALGKERNGNSFQS